MCNVEAHILSQEDPFEFVYECISGTHGPELMDYVNEMYNQIVIDNGWHPDDEFEEIIHEILNQMENM